MDILFDIEKRELIRRIKEYGLNSTIEPDGNIKVIFSKDPSEAEIEKMDIVSIIQDFAEEGTIH